MLSAPAHQIVLVVNGISLLENLKLDDAVAKNAYEFTFIITLPLFLLHSGLAFGDAPSLSLAEGNERHGPRQSLTWRGTEGSNPLSPRASQ
jgi:hypothetical protein